MTDDTDGTRARRDGPGSRASHGAGQAVSTASGFDPSRVTADDAHRFLETAIRNWDIDGQIDNDDLEDVRAELERFVRGRIAATKLPDREARARAASPTPDQGHPHD